MKIYIINVNDVCKIWYLKNELTNDGGNVQYNAKYLQQYSILQEIRCHKWPRICWVGYFLIHCQSPWTVVFCKSLFVRFVLFFLWPLYCLVFFSVQLLITTLVSSRFSNDQSSFNSHIACFLYYVQTSIPIFIVKKYNEQ